MPLAVIRVKVADLPYRFVLDDRAALSGSPKLTAQASVVVEARIARSGQAQVSSGDLFGTVSGVKPGSGNVRLVIDQVQP